MVEVVKGYYPVVPFCIVSILSCSFVISLSFLYKEKLYAEYETKLVVILLIFYDCLCLSSLIPVSNENQDLCVIQGCLIQFFSLSGILWTGFINLVNYRGVILRKTINLRINYPLILIILIGLISVIVPLVTYKYEPSTCWCWYRVEKEPLSNIYVFIFFYGIGWSVILFILYAFIRIWRHNKKANAELHRYKQLKFIPIILFLCFIPMTISRILFIISDSYKTNQSLKNFSIFASCLMRSLGFLNSIVYGYHSNIRNIFFDAYKIIKVDNKTEEDDEDRISSKI